MYKAVLGPPTKEKNKFLGLKGMKMAMVLHKHTHLVAFADC